MAAVHEILSPPVLLGFAAIITAVGSVLAAYASVIAARRRKDDEQAARLAEIERRYLELQSKLDEDLRDRWSGLT